MRGTPQVIHGVTVIGDLGAALVCQVGGRRTLIPLALVLEGSEVEKPGDHGMLFIPQEFAFDLGLAVEDDPEPLHVAW
jgi:hypothetical protein